MAHTKAGGTAKNLTDSNAQYLGVKLYAGETAKVGSILVRQRGTKFLAGKNVGLGKDHTLFALKNGIVEYTNKRKIKFDGEKLVKKVANVISDDKSSEITAESRRQERRLTQKETGKKEEVKKEIATKVSAEPVKKTEEKVPKTTKIEKKSK